MISVLMPSRERSQLARESILSLGSNFDLFEVLVYVDEDDPELQSYVELTKIGAQIFIGKRHGYINFHKMINHLAKYCKGDWLMLWNDDAIMRTDKWADIIDKNDCDKPVVLNFFDPLNKLNNLFPVISKPMYEAMNHYSLNTHCDSWVQDIANELKIHKPVARISCEHRRETINDKIKTETQNTYKTSSPAYDKMKSERQIDIDKIRKLL